MLLRIGQTEKSENNSGIPHHYEKIKLHRNILDMNCKLISAKERKDSRTHSLSVCCLSVGSLSRRHNQ
jgi:hypothetical protein